MRNRMVCSGHLEKRIIADEILTGGCLRIGLVSNWFNRICMNSMQVKLI